jgi:NAD(P)-dependent dehydrogenase (short-subunit alcohol dehydrogenase family)
VQADVGTVEGAQATVAAVAEVTDRLDQLVHCAVDTALSGPILEMGPHRFAKAVQCNGLALLPLVQTALPLFRRGSAVVFVSSRGSQIAVAGYGAVGVNLSGQCFRRRGRSGGSSVLLSATRVGALSPYRRWSTRSSFCAPSRRS